MVISIKGKSGGVLEIAMQPLASYADIRLAISEKLSKNKDFFTGTYVKVLFSGKVLSAAQKKELRRILLMDYDIKNVLFADEEPESLQEVDTVTSNEAPAAESSTHVSLVSKDYFNAKSVFVSHTLRSGQRVECEGDVVVLGDVNDGAEVIAGGSIAVMGALRGLAHAGATGRSDVVVAANILGPKQLRISGKIAAFPADKTGDMPELAEYKDGSIVIRPLKPQKRGAIRSE
jgi:septum site-determining protein MinC